MQLKLEQVIEANQRYLALPIVNDKTFFDFLEPGTDRVRVEDLISTYLSANDSEIRVGMEQEIRLMFKGRLPTFAVVHHSPECRRDYFITFNDGRKFIYAGSSGI